MWNYWKAAGIQQKTTRARRIALSELKSMSMISQSATDKTGSKGVAATETWQSLCGAWQSSRDYVARDGSGDPRGRKPGRGWGAHNPTFPTWTEGEKRFLSATRNPYAAMQSVAWW
jgi:hypothetical protein